MTAHSPVLRKRRQRADRFFRAICFGAAGIGTLILFLVLGRILLDGLPRLSGDFVFGKISASANKTGVWPAVVGTLWIAVLTTLVSVPVGVGAAIYLEEFTVKKNPFTRFIALNIANLSGVPSIVYGLLGLAVFVRGMQLGQSVLAGALTMAVLVLPTVIIVTSEALKAVPQAFREAALGLGATRWQAIRRQVFPAALPGIVTGVIISVSRAIAGRVAAPDSPGDKYTVLPRVIFSWANEAQDEWQRAAASAIVVLMVALLVINGVAIWLRDRARR